MPKKQKVSDWFEPLKLLAQEWSNNDERIQEYSCLDKNSALIVAKINSFIEIIPEVYPDLKPIIPLLEMKKSVVIQIGHAIWLSEASELTNLGGIVPRKTKELDLKKELE